MRHGIASLVLLAAGCTVMPPIDDAASLADAERAFAALSVRTDMANAFVANFADDGVMVGDGWITARAAFAGRPPPPVRLDWAPSQVEVAASGELGLSTGPWIRTSRTHAEAPAAHGHFVSIWRRDASGRWKVEVDIGIFHPEAVPIPALAESIAPADVAPGGDSLEQAEARFVEVSLRSGTRAAYDAFASRRFRLYRDGHAPYAGRARALEAAASRDERTLWLTDAREASRSGEFGYVRGTYANAAAPDRVLGHFMRVWRREGGAWAVVLDVTHPRG